MDDNLYSIGEVAKKLNLPVHTIRYWATIFKHIEFATKNGRRYFDNTAIDEFKKIKELEHKKGLTIDGIKQLLRYKKIDMNKLDKVNKNIISNQLDKAISIIQKQLSMLQCKEDNII